MRGMYKVTVRHGNRILCLGTHAECLEWVNDAIDPYAFTITKIGERHA